MIAISYSRFSPRPGAADCESCERQAQDIQNWCKKKEWTIEAEYADKEYSGDSSDRENLWTAVAAASRKGYALVVRNLDRLARSVILQELIIERVRKKGGVVISLAGEGAVEGDDECGQDAMVRQIFGAINEQRRKMICWLTHKGMVRNQKQGKLQTRRDGTPYGTRYDEATGKVVDDPKEKEILAKILAWQAEGKRSEAITTLLNAEGIKAKRGGKWCKTSVRKILLREVEGKTVWRQRDSEAVSMPA